MTEMNNILTIENGIVTKCDKSATEITIPDGVTEISSKAFCFCENLKSVTFPDSLKTIGELAFFDCSSLNSVTIPASVELIYNKAFLCCSALNKVELLNPDIKLAVGVFKGCKSLADKEGFVIVNNILFDYFGSETEIIIPDTVNTISASAFSGNSDITSVRLSESVTVIGSAFKKCNKLADKNGFIIINDVLCDYIGTETEITIPDTVEVIGDYAFFNKKFLRSVTIPDSVTTICPFAFCGCMSITEITIPESVKAIGLGIFEFCGSLTRILVPDDNELSAVMLFPYKNAIVYYDASKK